MEVKMVANKKAQGLPLHLIVIAVIAALILVIVIAFTIGGAGAFFSKIFSSGQAAIGDDTDVVKTTCNGLCDTAKGSLTVSAFQSSAYCSRTFNIDLNKDGMLNDTIGEDDEVGLSCAKLDVACSVVIAGNAVTC